MRTIYMQFPQIQLHAFILSLNSVNIVEEHVSEAAVLSNLSFIFYLS